MLDRDELLANWAVSGEISQSHSKRSTLYADEQLDFPEHRRDRVVIDFVGYPNVGEIFDGELVNWDQAEYRDLGKRRDINGSTSGSIDARRCAWFSFPSFASSRQFSVRRCVASRSINGFRVPVSKIASARRKSLEVVTPPVTKAAACEGQNEPANG